MKIDCENICGISAFIISIVLILLGVKITPWAIPVWILAAIAEHNCKE